MAYRPPQLDSTPNIPDILERGEDLHSLLYHLESTSDSTGVPEYNFFDRSELIQYSVSSGMLIAAAKLAGDSDPVLRCMLICSLYEQGYTELAEEHLLKIAHKLVPPRTPYQEAARIYGEILYDQARYEEAAAIFTALAETCPSMASVRYASAACRLQEKVLRLRRRMELYHPDQDERLKIEKYIHGFLDMLAFIEQTHWHSKWNDKQRSHLPEHLSANIKQNRS
ncbi:tetratricopeptide repeat protein [Paenibacillus motobuensis]|uniref:Tetratricopeptide repeat protein n=1 Tax=Paenibacillus motobuensis TaxID=295324 RepID=A0ABN0YNR5_9BACL